MKYLPLLILLTACGPDQDLVELYFQAAYPTGQCEGLNPTYVVIKHTEGTITKPVKEINSGVKSDPFFMDLGNHHILSIEVFNDQGRTHYVKHISEADKQEVVMGVPFLQKINEETLWIAAGLHCD